MLFDMAGSQQDSCRTRVNAPYRAFDSADSQPIIRSGQRFGWIPDLPFMTNGDCEYPVLIDHNDRPGSLRRLTVVSLLLWSATAPIAQADDPFTGSSPSYFVHPGSPGLQMPTDVAIAPDGGVYIADGTNNRVVRFTAGGKWVEDIRAVGESSLLRPLGLDYHATDGLWIADSGNHRAIQLKSDGSAGRVLAPAADANEYPADVTDIAASPDGGVVWLADNDNHRLIRWGLANDGQVRVGDGANRSASCTTPSCSR